MVSKTVFLSYRRTNVAWAVAVSQHLTTHGFDVFFDFTGLASGDFAQLIVENIRARAHFVVILTPSALERVHEPGDWLRREIEAAMAARRNVVPLLFDDFSFREPAIARRLTGSLATLTRYNALSIPPAYFEAGMERLRKAFLTVDVDAVLHPPSARAGEEAERQRAMVIPLNVSQEQLEANASFERGVFAVDPAEQIDQFSEALRLHPSFAEAFYNRGTARATLGDLAGSVADLTEAIRLRPHAADFYINRGNVYSLARAFDKAVADLDHAAKLSPHEPSVYYNRGYAHEQLRSYDAALADYNTALRCDPHDARSLFNRSRLLEWQGDVAGARKDLELYLLVGSSQFPDSIRAVELRLADLKRREG